LDGDDFEELEGPLEGALALGFALPEPLLDLPFFDDFAVAAYEWLGVSVHSPQTTLSTNIRLLVLENKIIGMPLLYNSLRRALGVVQLISKIAAKLDHLAQATALATLQKKAIWRLHLSVDCSLGKINMGG
jgi:hypothetical protein